MYSRFLIAFSIESGPKILESGSWNQAPGLRVLVVACLVLNIENSANSAGACVTKVPP